MSNQPTRWKRGGGDNEVKGLINDPIWKLPGFLEENGPAGRDLPMTDASEGVQYRLAQPIAAEVVIKVNTSYGACLADLQL